MLTKRAPKPHNVKIFFGAPIQGHTRWGEQAETYAFILRIIRESRGQVLSEHAAAFTREETNQKLEDTLGPLPEEDYERRVHVRNKMIEFLERDDLSGIIFEVSTPSLGTGIEIAHAYLRVRLGLKPVPILLLYKKDFWPNKLSTMVRGVPLSEYPNFNLIEYSDFEGLQKIVRSFVEALGKEKILS